MTYVPVISWKRMYNNVFTYKYWFKIIENQMVQTEWYSVDDDFIKECWAYRMWLIKETKLFITRLQNYFQKIFTCCWHSCNQTLRGQHIWGVICVKVKVISPEITKRKKRQTLYAPTALHANFIWLKINCLLNTVLKL